MTRDGRSVLTRRERVRHVAVLVPETIADLETSELFSENTRESWTN